MAFTDLHEGILAEFAERSAFSIADPADAVYQSGPMSFWGHVSRAKWSDAERPSVMARAGRKGGRIGAELEEREMALWLAKNPGWMSTRQVAERLGIAERTVAHLPLVPVRAVRKRVAFARAAVEAEAARRYAKHRRTAERKSQRERRRTAAELREAAATNGRAGAARQLEAVERWLAKNPGWATVAEVAEHLGTSTFAVNQCAKRIGAKKVAGRLVIPRSALPPPGWVRVREAAALGGLSKTALCDAARRGRVSTFRFTERLKYYDPEDVRRYVAEATRRRARKKDLTDIDETRTVDTRKVKT